MVVSTTAGGETVWTVALARSGCNVGCIRPTRSTRSSGPRLLSGGQPDTYHFRLRRSGCGSGKDDGGVAGAGARSNECVRIPQPRSRSNGQDQGEWHVQTPTLRLRSEVQRMIAQSQAGSDEGGFLLARLGLRGHVCWPAPFRCGGSLTLLVWESKRAPHGWL